jgi:hypothetical protein
MNEFLQAGWGTGPAAQPVSEPRFFLKSGLVFPPQGTVGGLGARIEVPLLCEPFFIKG